MFFYKKNKIFYMIYDCNIFYLYSCIIQKKCGFHPRRKHRGFRRKYVTKSPSLTGLAAIVYIQKNRVTVTVNQKSHIARPNRQTERAFSIKHAFFSATGTRNFSLFNTKEAVTVNIMYIRLSSLRQTRFGYADSAFCLHFFCRFFLFISNMLNNLKSVTFFQKFFQKLFVFFCMPAGRYAAGRGNHSPAIFSGKAGIKE